MTRRNPRRPRRNGGSLAGRATDGQLWLLPAIQNNLGPLLFAVFLSALFVAVTHHNFLVALASGKGVPYRWWAAMLGKGVLALAIFLVGFAYVLRLEPARLRMRRLLLPFGVLAILFAAGAQAVVELARSPYVLPLSAAGLLLTLLHSRRAALVLSGLLALLVGLTLEQAGSVPFLVVLTLFAGAALMALALAQIRTRLAIVEAGAAVAAVQVALLLAGRAAGLYEPGATEAGASKLLRDLTWAAANGVGVGVVMTAALPLVERLFGMTTQISLLELSDQNHPLMRRMVVEAPGTYHHSFMLGTLTETAAEAIGANALLARVGAYFHDIGKLTRPEYFVENAVPGLNPHDHLSPTMSAMIIAAHPKDGVELGRDYRLPPQIVNIIAEHHGNSVIEYFYRRSQDQRHGEHAPDQAFFRYTGLRPQTKEAGIVLLGDAVEAASRTLVAPTAARLKRLVHEISMKRLLDGQFDECGLTLAQLHRIEDSFVRTLCSLFHARIHYPPEQATRRVRRETEAASP